MMWKATGVLICLLPLISVAFCEVDQRWESCSRDDINQDLNQNSFSKGDNIGEELGYFLPFQTGINIVNANGGNNRIDQNLDQKAWDSCKGFEFETPELISQSGFNLVNTNDTNLTVRNFNGNSAANQRHGTEESSQAGNYNVGIGYKGNLYTINFININYGDFSKESHLGMPAKSDNFCNHESLQETLERLTQLASIHERERKENLQLLKRIAS